MHIHVLFSSEQASCQLSRHSCLFHQPLIKLEHCGTCSRPISHLHQVYFARYCFTFSNSCMVRKTCGTLRMFTSAREPLLILFRGRRQGRQPLIRPGAPWPCPCRRRFSPLRRREGPPPQPPTSPPRQKLPRFTVFCALPIFSHFSDLVAQDGSTWANIGRKMGQHSPKMGQHSPKMGQHSAQDGSR